MSAVRRLLLVRHATTAAVRRAAFPIDEPLDAGGSAAAARLAGRLGSGEALCSPALRTRQTAAAAGLAATVDEALRECDFGAWGGRALADVHGSEPEAVEAWLSDPAACPHGGETVAALVARVGAWLDAQARRGGRAIAVTHGGVVRAAVVHALGAPPTAVWRLDVAPLSITELHARDGRWTVARVNAGPVAEGERGRPATGAPAGAGAAGGRP